MADTLELQVAKGIEDALNVVGVTVAAGTVQRPQGLTVHRQRMRAIEHDDLPAQVVYIIDEQPRANEDAGAGLLIRRLRIGVESRVDVPEDVNPDDALDELKAWADIAVMADETLGGVSHLIDIGAGTSLVEEGAKTLARHARVFDVQYQRLRNDPRTAT